MLLFTVFDAYSFFFPQYIEARKVVILFKSRGLSFVNVLEAILLLGKPVPQISASQMI